MENKQVSKELLLGSILAIIGTVCYILAISVPVSPSIGFILVSIWPISAIVASFAFYKYVSLTKQSFSNQLSFLFAVIAFVLVYIMAAIQIGLKSGLGDTISNSTGREKEVLTLILNSSQWIHLGIDVAWDIFLGCYLILLSIVVKNHPEFKIWWAIPMFILGLLVIVINMYTFPYTPKSAGLIDIGPFIGLFMVIWAIRIIQLSIKLKKQL